MELSDNEKKVYDFVKNNSNDFLNLVKISDDTKLSYPTIRNSVRVLEIMELIDVIKIGNNKFVKLI